MEKTSPVRITGLGCISAAGNTLPESLASLAAGRRAPASPGLFSTPLPFPVFSCTASLPTAPFIDGEEEFPLSRTVLLALCACREALDHARFPTEVLTQARIGVCLGTSVGAALNFLDAYTRHKQGEPLEPAPIHRYRASNPALAVARALGVRGPVQTVTNACSSGADALGIAANWIRQGLCDAVIAGGADELSEITYTGFASLMIMDETPCRPFDRTRKGLNLGEGAGILIMESTAFAQRRAATAQAFLLGYGTATDAYHLTAPHPQGIGLKKATHEALTQAGLTGVDLAFINAHGTATLNNDIAEGAVFSEVFSTVPFIATKGITGHTLGAAGAIEAVFTAAHLLDGTLPASPGFWEEDPAIGISPVTSPLSLTQTAALSQSLAFGGNNSVVILGKGGDADVYRD